MDNLQNVFGTEGEYEDFSRLRNAWAGKWHVDFCTVLGKESKPEIPNGCW
jgi:hypothetical protein